jgi:hypothetical protein
MTESEQILSRVVTEIYSPLYQLAAGVAIVYFIYGAAKYVYDLNTSNAEQQTFGRSHLFYGAIGLFIVLSVGGILNVFRDFFGGWLQ